MVRWFATLLVVYVVCMECRPAVAFSWQPCDQDQVPFMPDEVHLNPDPPVIGSQVLFNIVGKNDGAIRLTSSMLRG